VAAKTFGAQGGRKAAFIARQPPHGNRPPSQYSIISFGRKYETTYSSAWGTTVVKVIADKGNDSRGKAQAQDAHLHRALPNPEVLVKRNVDVPAIGRCTAGLFFAGLMADLAEADPAGMGE
jgi:hypothetical protein